MWSENKTGVERVKHVGFGCVLMDMRLVDAIDPPYFVFAPDGEHGLTTRGEDVYFCEKLLRDAGIPTHVDHDLSHEIGHIGEQVFSMQHAYTGRTVQAEMDAIKAAEKAINNPLLEAGIDGAHGVLMLIQAAGNMGLHEVSEASALIQESVSPNANVIFGVSYDDSLGDEMRVTVIAAGFDGGAPVRRPSMPISMKTNTDQIQVIDVESPEVAAVVIETPAAFREDVATANDDTFGGYLGEVKDISPVTEAIELPRTERKSEGFGDDLDIPDFLK